MTHTPRFPFEKKVNEDNLMEVLRWIRDLRKKALFRKMEPWTVRQGLVMALEFDTESALERGISKGTLDRFDNMIKEDLKKWFKTSKKKY